MLKKKIFAKVRFHKLAKVNKGKNVHRCAHCLELSTFRVFQLNGANRLGCVICLNSCKYRKHLEVWQHKVVRLKKLEFKDLLKRQWLRTKVYFKGNHIYGPFKIRRRK